MGQQRICCEGHLHVTIFLDLLAVSEIYRKGHGKWGLTKKNMLGFGLRAAGHDTCGRLLNISRRNAAFPVLKMKDGNKRTGIQTPTRGRTNRRAVAAGADGLPGTCRTTPGLACSPMTPATAPGAPTARTASAADDPSPALSSGLPAKLRTSVLGQTTLGRWPLLYAVLAHNEAAVVVVSMV